MASDKRFFQLPKENTFPGDAHAAPYVFTDDIAIAINVAYVTKRPLLVEGKPGCGKSRLAEALAGHLGWHFLHKTITSRTSLDDLTNEFDLLKRLHDAQVSDGQNKLAEDWEYNRPGVFWWAFNRTSAENKGQNEQFDPDNCYGVTRNKNNPDNKTVLLIDEIDKAQPDLPNDLLDTIERRRIELRDGRFIQAADKTETFTVITSNRERTLPKAFLRRCVFLYIDEPSEEDLKRIAHNHLENLDDELLDGVIDKVLQYRETEAELVQRVPGTSEFLDALRACQKLKITPKGNSKVWQQIENLTLLKKAHDTQ